MHLRKILRAANQRPAERYDLSRNPRTPTQLQATSLKTLLEALQLPPPHPLSYTRIPSSFSASSWPPPARSRGWSPTAAPLSCRWARPQTSLPQRPAQQPQRVPLNRASVCPRPSAGTRATSLRWTRPASTSSWPSCSAACTSCWSNTSVRRKSTFHAIQMRALPLAYLN